MATKAIIDKQHITISKSFKDSSLFFYPLFAVLFATALALVIVGLLLATPIISMFSNHYLYRGVFLLAFGLLIFIPFAIIVGLVNVSAPLFIVIYKLKVKNAVNSAFDLISKFWPQLMGFGFVLILLELPALFLSVIMVGWLRGWVPILVAAIIVLAWESGVNAFAQTVWVLVFLQLVKPQKTEEFEAGAVPETIAGG